MPSYADTLYGQMLRQRMMGQAAATQQAEQERIMAEERRRHELDNVFRVAEMLSKAEEQQHKRTMDIAGLAGKYGAPVPPSAQNVPLAQEAYSVGRAGGEYTDAQKQAEREAKIRELLTKEQSRWGLETHKSELDVREQQARDQTAMDRLREQIKARAEEGKRSRANALEVARIRASNKPKKLGDLFKQDYKTLDNVAQDKRYRFRDPNAVRIARAELTALEDEVMRKFRNGEYVDYADVDRRKRAIVDSIVNPKGGGASGGFGAEPGHIDLETLRKNVQGNVTGGQ